MNNLHPNIGAEFEGGYFGGVIQLRESVCAVVWAPKYKGETSGEWHTGNPEFIAPSMIDSMANTLAMASIGSRIATWASCLRINGYEGWCVPSKDVLEMGYRYLKPCSSHTDLWSRSYGENVSSIPAGKPYRDSPPTQTRIAHFQSGQREYFESSWYWSSTQSSSGSARDQSFAQGCQDHSNVNFRLRVRAVRIVPLYDKPQIDAT